jgi:hypothetical protein
MYPLHSKAVNFSINATVGAFSAKRLNSELIPNERVEVTDGAITRGMVRIDVRADVATTTVTPEYHDLSIKVLATDVHKKSGIIEGVKTFIANTFTIRSNNMNADGKQAVSATTSLKRTKDQEFLQFVWLTLRKSLGKVVGFNSPKSK